MFNNGGSSSSGTSSGPIMFTNILGQGRVNQLGGVFINGRPLPHHLRAKIVEMSAAGVRPCVISRQLRVSHGCVSKILGRYTETGSIAPGQVGGSRPRVAMHSLEKQIVKLKQDSPSLFSWEIREKLIDQGLCGRSQAPSVAAINRLLRSRGLKPGNRDAQMSADDDSTTTGNDINLDTVTELPQIVPNNKKTCQRQTDRKTGSLRKYSIDSILGNYPVTDEEDDSDDAIQESETEDETSSTKRRNRTCFLPEQLEILERSFQECRYPDSTTRDRLAKETNLSDNKIQVWFSNRRARWRKHLGVSAFTSSCTPLLFGYRPPTLPPILQPQCSSALQSPTCLSWLQPPMKQHHPPMDSNGQFRLPHMIVPYLHHSMDSPVNSSFS